MALTSSQKKQLNKIKKQAESIQKQINKLPKSSGSSGGSSKGSSKPDIITDPVTGKQYSRTSSTDTYKPYSGSSGGSSGGSSSASSALDIITDPVTGKQYSRTSSTGTYAPYTGNAGGSTTGSTATSADKATQLKALNDELGTLQQRLAGIKSAQQLGYTGNDEDGANAFMVNLQNQQQMPFGDVSAADAANQALQKRYDMNYQQEQDRVAREEQRRKDELQLQKSWLKDMISPLKAREEAQSETGIKAAEYFAEQQAGIAEINALTEEYNKELERKDQAIALAYGRQASNSFIDNQIAQIERNAAPKLNRLSANVNAKAAALQAKQGNFAEAQKFVDQAVQDAVADNKYRLDMFSTFYEINADAFARLDKIYTESYDNARKIAEDEYNQKLDEKTKVGELALTYWQSGIDIYNDSLEQAMQKALKSGADPETLLQMENIRADNARLASETGGSGGLTRSEREDLADDIAFIASGGDSSNPITTRAEAESWLNKYRGTILTKYGEYGYTQMQNEINRLFKPVIPTNLNGPQSTIPGQQNQIQSLSGPASNPLSGLQSGYGGFSTEDLANSFLNIFNQ